MIQPTIDDINELIPEPLTGKGPFKVSGLAMPMYDQQEKATRLFLPMEPKTPRLVLDNSLFWQSAHLWLGGEPVKTTQWGSYYESSYNINMMLIGVCRLGTGLTVALRALAGTPNVVKQRFEIDTQEVLQRYWRHPVTSDKGSDPGWWAFAVRYQIQGITDHELATYTEILDQAL